MTIHARDMGTYIVQYGTNADRRALDAGGIQPLTEFHETDTGIEYKWFDSWIDKSSTAGTAAIGSKSDARGTWYTDVMSLISAAKLAIAALVDAGSHAYGYTNGVLTTDAWTLFGTTRTKTYGHTNGVLTSESDWV